MNGPIVSTPTVDTLIVDAHLATMVPGGPPYGAITDAAVGITGDRIEWVGARSDAPAAGTTWSATGRWITPGLVDCHTHLVFAGSRVDEFERRLAGASYEEVAAAGGGIASTVAATRAVTEDELVDTAIPRLRWLTEGGVTTVEVKSGYGLETETELRMLRAARRLSDHLPVDVVCTFLGAHALPPGESDRNAYIDRVCGEMIPAVVGLADAVDGFCETVGFTRDEVARVFTAAREAGLPVKLHADQLSDSGGAELAASFWALSADHLEHVAPDGIARLAEAGTTAVLLPGAFQALGETDVPPVDALRDAGVPIAVATDLNPGSSPVGSLQLMCAMAATSFGLDAEEALASVTRVAARALGRESQIGTVEVGKRADLAVWEIDAPAEVAYWMGADLCSAVWFGGRLVYERGGRAT